MPINLLTKPPSLNRDRVSMCENTMHKIVSVTLIHVLQREDVMRSQCSRHDIQWVGKLDQIFYSNAAEVTNLTLRVSYLVT